MNKGFTLIELLIVTFIIVLLTAFTLPNYRAGDRQLSLERSAHKLAQDLRRTQEMTMSSKEFPGGPDTFKGGYGIYFNLFEPNHYILFADLDNENDYDSGEGVETLELEEKVEINSLSPVNPLTIVFIPPDPTTIFSLDVAAASISLVIGETEGEASEYFYYYTQTLDDWVHPRADCDNNPQDEECRDSFPASALDSPLVHDWFGKEPDKQSKEYEKRKEEDFSTPQKTIQINKVGLIAVE